MNSSGPQTDLFYFNRSFVNNGTSFYASINISETLPTVKWTVLPVLFAVSMVFGLISNGTLLYLFIKDRALRTPFNVYLMNLLIADLLKLTEYPLGILYYIHSFRWFWGNQLCTLYQYLFYVLTGTTFCSHAMIAIIRVWATVHPVSYRNHNSYRTAILLCSLMWLYGNLTIGYGWANDALYYRVPAEKSNLCMLDLKAQRTWRLFIQFAVFDVVSIIMLGSFVVIIWAKLNRKKGKKRKNIVSPGLPVNTVSTNLSTKPIQDNLPMIQPPENEVPETKSRQPKQKSHGTLLLALLTISVTVCWTPGNTYFTLQLFLPVYNSTAVMVSVIMTSCQTMLDPILFILAMPSLRKSVRSLVLRSR